jgi:hypothetical protein
MYERLHPSAAIAGVLINFCRFIFAFKYLPASSVVHKCIAQAIFTAFLFISVIPELFAAINRGPEDNGPYENGLSPFLAASTFF